MKKMKRSTKRWITLIAVALCCLTVGALLGNIFDIGNPNEDNLWQSATFAEEGGVICDGADGVTVKLTDDNAVKVNGYAETAQEILLGTVELQANTSYIFDSSLNDGSNKTVYMVIKSGDTVLAKSYTGPVVITAEKLAMNAEAQIYLIIAEDVDVNETLRPVICEGETVDELVSFY